MHDIESLSSVAEAVAGHAARTWLPGLPHVLLGLATGFVFGWPACVAGLMLAALVSFVVFLPLTALTLNGGRPIGSEDEVPSLGLGAHAALLALWTATAWGAAAVAALGR